MFNRININFRKANKKKNISEIELAQKLKIDIQTLKNWETGLVLPSPEMIIKISKILNISTDLLLFSEEREPLDISKLSPEDKLIVRNFCEQIKKKNR